MSLKLLDSHVPRVISWRNCLVALELKEGSPQIQWQNISLPFSLLTTFNVIQGRRQMKPKPRVSTETSGSRTIASSNWKWSVRWQAWVSFCQKPTSKTKLMPGPALRQTDVDILQRQTHLHCQWGVENTWKQTEFKYADGRKPDCKFTSPLCGMRSLLMCSCPTPNSTPSLSQ